MTDDTIKQLIPEADLVASFDARYRAYHAALQRAGELAATLASPSARNDEAFGGLQGVIEFERLADRLQRDIDLEEALTHGERKTLDGIREQQQIWANISVLDYLIIPSAREAETAFWGSDNEETFDSWIEKTQGSARPALGMLSSFASAADLYHVSKDIAEYGLSLYKRLYGRESTLKPTQLLISLSNTQFSHNAGNPALAQLHDELQQYNHRVKYLQDRFSKSGVIADTELRYRSHDKRIDGHSFQMLHHSRSSMPQRFLDSLPVYEKKDFGGSPRGTSITTVVNDEGGELFVKKLFGTEDSADQIMDVLETISGKGRDEIRVHSPSRKQRLEKPDRAVTFGYSPHGLFDISLSTPLDYSGHALLIDRFKEQVARYHREAK